MNVSWSDLSNVDQAGEYPFRDGTITVTFAEIAVWKKSDQERIYIGGVFFLCRCRRQPAGHIGGLICEDLHEVDLGRDIGNRRPGALVARLQRNSSTAP